MILFNHTVLNPGQLVFGGIINCRKDSISSFIHQLLSHVSSRLYAQNVIQEKMSRRRTTFQLKAVAFADQNFEKGRQRYLQKYLKNKTICDGWQSVDLFKFYFMGFPDNNYYCLFMDHRYFEKIQ